MKLKSIFAATILAVSAASSFATGGALVFAGNSAAFGSNVTGTFSDTWTFTLPTSSTVGASAANVAVSFGNFSMGGITSFAAMLDSTPLTLTTTPAGIVTVQVLGGGLVSAAGAHSLTISGTAGLNASYGGNVVTAPVPEPESYAMLLAGLGLMGAIARRRNKSKAV